MGNSKRATRGFSLLEILVSIVILTVLATGFLGTAVYARKKMETGNQRMIAASLLQKKITEFRIQGAENLAVVTNASERAEELYNGVLVWTISMPEAGNENWKEVVLTAGWDSMMKDEVAAPQVPSPGTREFSKTVVVFLSQG